jgi:putative glutamine amidotransferase
VDSRPLIGICAALEPARWSVWELPAVLLPADYLVAIQRAGGLPLMIAPDEALAENPGELLDRLDGLILAGGCDIDPSAYGASPEEHTFGTVPLRDRTELALAREAVARDLPLLGICRGMQLLNVARGGSLIQHLPDHLGHEEHRRTPGTFEGSEHDVTIDPGTRAADAIGEAHHEVKSHHHQAIDRLGEGLVISGRSTLDELPEAIELPDRRFTLGVQWHPEADGSSRVIAALVERAREYRAVPAS